MQPIITNLLSLSLVATTTFGVLMHDMRIDKATVVAFAAPAALAAIALADISSKSNEHVHVEKASSSSHLGYAQSNVPKVPPREDARRYTQEKKNAFINGETTTLWPST